jgi:hypothetical protein
MAKKVKAKIKEIDKKIKEKKKDKVKKNEKKAKKKVSLRFVLANTLKLRTETVYVYKPESKKSHNVFTRTEKQIPSSEFELLSILIPARGFDTVCVKKYLGYLEKNSLLVDTPSPYDGKYAEMFNVPMVRITSKYTPDLLDQEVVRMSVIVDLTRKDSLTNYRILFSSETEDTDNLSWKKIKIK